MKTSLKKSKRLAVTVKWAPVDSLPGVEISNTGILRKGRIVYRLYKDCMGALICAVRVAGIPNNVRIARLVGEAFCPDFEPSLRPIHRDGDRSNCHACNLRWVPQSMVTGVPYSKSPRPQRGDRKP